MGCRAKSPVNVLVRVGVDLDGRLVIGRGQAGRGAWIHSDSGSCIDQAIERRGFQRGLRRDFPEVELEELRNRFIERAERGEGVGG